MQSILSNEVMRTGEITNVQPIDERPVGAAIRRKKLVDTGGRLEGVPQKSHEIVSQRPGKCWRGASNRLSRPPLR